MASECDAANDTSPTSTPNIQPSCQQRGKERNYYMSGKIMANRIFVGGFDHLVTEHDLCHVFSEHGKVKDAKIVMSPSGMSKGYGFVTFENNEDVSKILRNDNISFREKKLTVGHAFHKPISRVKYIPCPAVPPPGAWGGPPRYFLPAIPSTQHCGGPHMCCHNVNYCSYQRPPPCYTHQQFSPNPYQWRAEPQVPFPPLAYVEPPYYSYMPANRSPGYLVPIMENPAEEYVESNVATDPPVASEN